MKTATRISRRDFIKATTTGGAGLIIGLYVPLGRSSLGAQTAENFLPNVWLRIGRSGEITVTVAKSDMGQGIRTSLPMILAEELEADWTTIRVDQAKASPEKYGSMNTGGSTSIRTSWERLRKAGAAAREMLVSAAAQQWGVDRSTCFAENGAVVHRPTGRKTGYGRLVDVAARLPVPQDPPLKDRKDFRLVGKWMRQLDTPAKSSGRATFGIDVTVPGMLHASLVRSPVFGGSPRSVDAAAAMAVPGVKDVVRLKEGVAVVATSTWAALKGRDALTISWDEGPNTGLSSASIRNMFLAKGDSPGQVAEKNGDVDAAAASARTRVQAVYEVPFLAHATMEPMNCVADVRSDRCEIWTGSQSPQSAQNETAAALGLPKEKVTVNVMFLGGGFGRRSDNDFVAEAVAISAKVKAPVKLLWTREDDIRSDWYRPASMHQLSGGVDGLGALVAWKHRIIAPSIIGQRWPAYLKGLDESAIDCAVKMPYNIPHLLVDYVMANTPVPISWWRSVYASQNVFAVECFVDELAAAAKKDPVAFRLQMLDKSPRMKRVVETVAEKAGWGKNVPKGHGLGVACATSFGSHVAEVAEVSVEKEGSVRIHRVVAAVDCGSAVAPNTLTYNIEGGVVYGLSAVLRGEITIGGGRVLQGNFDDYPVLTMGEMPQVSVHIVESGEDLGGIGEPGLPPVAPAVCNAVFAATGRRVRTLPIRLV